MSLKTDSVNIGGSIALPTAIIGSDPSAGYGQGLTVRDAGADVGCLLYTNRSMYAFAEGILGERSGMTLEFSNQLGFYYNNSRICYMNTQGINFQTSVLLEYRTNVANSAATGNITTAGTGSVYTNIGATGTIVLTLPAAATGWTYTFYRVADFAMRIQPLQAAGSAIIVAAGKQADDNYVELGAVGSSIKLVCNSQGDWMAVSENGTITPE